jgi:hypothetical protein
MLSNYLKEKRMSSRGLKLMLVVSMLFAAAAGVSRSASAAPVLHGISTEMPASTATVQKIYWVWRHHHRVWVRPHHR